MRGWRMVAAALALTAFLGAPARAADDGSWAEDAGWGTLTMLANVAYMPAKLVYSVLGGVTGSFAFALTGGDLDVAENVWVPSMGGTYVLTPRMLQGEDAIVFAASRGNDRTSDAGPTATDDLGGGLHEDTLPQ
jgi:hypothetical protein